MDVNLKNWCNTAEEIGVQLTDEYFKMQVGLKYDQKRIANLEGENAKHSEEFLKSWKEPKELFNSCVESVASAKTHELLLKLHEDRKKKITSSKHKFADQPVNWNTWRQFVTVADDKSRKEVFDEFMKKTPLISPLIKKRFDFFCEINKKYGTNPLDSYLFEHKMNLSNLKEFLTTLQDGTRSAFKKKFSLYTNKFFKREPTYYDDFYFMRNVIYSGMDEGFKHVNSLEQIKKTFLSMNLDPSKIHVDDVDRPDKYPSPFAQFVKIPSDIRISYKIENPLNTARSIYHEMGHAIHASNIDANLPYWTKYLLSNGLAETFSIFFEDLLSDKEYLTKVLKLNSDYADDFIKRTTFAEAFSIALYTANSFFKIKYWSEDLPFEETNQIYTAELKKAFGFEIPGEYWQLHHILPESTMYVPSYMLAMVNAFNTTNELRSKLGIQWWKEKKAGKFMLDIMSPGSESRVSDFSKIDAKEYVKHIVELL